MAVLYGSIGGSVITKSSSTFDKIKDFLGKVAAHVPAEVVSIYAVGKSVGGPEYSGGWTLFCWILAVGFRWFGTNGQGKVLNVILTTIAFPIWAMSLGGNILGWSLPDRVLGLAVLGFSAIAGFLYDNK